MNGATQGKDSSVARLGTSILEALSVLGTALGLVVKAWSSPRLLWRRRDKIITELVSIGTNTLPIATLVSFFIGMVLVIQTADQLSNYSQEILGSVVGIAMTKELGPVIIAFLVAGRVGSAVAAQLGSMSINDEINALRTMDIDPVEFLVTPRTVAMTLAVPVLVLYADAVGILGGLVAVRIDPSITVSSSQFWDNLVSWLNMRDLIVGMIKGLFFGLTIAVVSCTLGLRTRGGTAEVARATTAAVVWSFVLVIVMDYFIVRAAVLLS
ncbi:MAG: ABC transporter permease [Deltaproteobacteria bacterium]